MSNEKFITSENEDKKEEIRCLNCNNNTFEENICLKMWGIFK